MKRSPYQGNPEQYDAATRGLHVAARNNATGLTLNANKPQTFSLWTKEGFQQRAFRVPI